MSWMIERPSGLGPPGRFSQPFQQATLVAGVVEMSRVFRSVRDAIGRG